jgi:hypothetical protein
VSAAKGSASDHLRGRFAEDEIAAYATGPQQRRLAAALTAECFMVTHSASVTHRQPTNEDEQA